MSSTSSFLLKKVILQLKENSMLQKFKITSYVIMVTLATVLVLPVNAAELQLVIHKGKPHRGEAFSSKKQRKRPTPQQRRDMHDPLAERERERVKAGYYECAAELERVFYDQLQPRMNTSLSQHDRRWDEETQRRMAALRPILANVQSKMTVLEDIIDHTTVRGNRAANLDIAERYIETINSLLASALEADTHLTGRLNDVQAGALRDIEHIKDTSDSWLAGDGPEVCGMSPRQ